MNKGLGRLVSKDARDNNFHIRAIMPRRFASITRKYWYPNGWWGNQGDSSYCVGYSLVFLLEDGPVPQKGIAPVVSPEKVYARAQEIDEWPGTGYDGTSVRAGAKVLQEMGFIGSYHWAFDLDTMVDAVLHLGPVVVGINWYNDMFEPNSKGIVNVGGASAGGHAIKVDGVDTVKKLFRLKNSWGREWGKKGFCYVPFEGMERLINEDGEVLIATE